MNKSFMFGFLAGVAVGGVGAFYFAKKQADKMIDEEVRSVKETFSECLFAQEISDQSTSAEKTPDNDPPKQEKDYNVMEQSHRQYVKALADYKNYATTTTHTVDEIVGSDRPLNPEIEYIGPGEMEDIEEYETIFYTFYVDGVMVEGPVPETAEVVDDPFSIIGQKEKFLEHVGEFEDFTLLGVNHRLKLYFEVTFLDEKFHEDEEEDD